MLLPTKDYKKLVDEDYKTVKWIEIPLINANHDLREDIYKNLAKKSRIKAESLVFDKSKLYHEPELARYCVVKGLTFLGSEFILVKGMKANNFLRIANIVFQIFKVDGSMGHIFYKIIDEEYEQQTTLF